MRLADAVNELDRMGDHLLIARHLEGMGLRGVRGDVIHCAIACYLRRRGFTALLADAKSIHGAWFRPGDHFAGRRDEVPTPQNVAMFMQLFDLGLYPELDAMPIQHQGATYGYVYEGRVP